MKKINRYLWALKIRGALIKSMVDEVRENHPAGRFFSTRKAVEDYLKRHAWRFEKQPEIVKVKVSIEEVE